MAFLPLVAAGIGAAAGAKNLLSGPGASYQPQGANMGDVNAVNQNLQQNQAQQQNFVNALYNSGGISNQNQVFADQGRLAGQLEAASNGQGPNPAQAALNNATGQNVANQAALMAGQRGAGANTGLIARQTAQQGANIQQQAVGQGAVMQANQQIAARQQLQQQQAAMGQLAGQQVGQTQQAVQSLGQQQLGQQGNILGSANNQNSTGANLAAQNQQMTGNLISNTAGALGSAGQLIGNNSAPASKASNGNIFGVQTQFAKGGAIDGPQSVFGMHLSSLKMAKGGKVPAMVSPGEVYLSPKKVQEVAKGKDPIKAGEKIPGKAKVKGDSEKNDTVPKTLEAGGIVLPKSVMESKHPHWEAHKFVSAIMAKKRHGG